MVPMMSKRPLIIALLLSAVVPAAASAQLLGGPVGGLTQPVTGPVTGAIGQIGNSVDQTVSGVTGVPLSREQRARLVAPSLDRVTTPLGVVESTAGRNYH